jgi:hypothetical protein
MMEKKEFCSLEEINGKFFPKHQISRLKNGYQLPESDGEKFANETILKISALLDNLKNSLPQK